MGWISLHEPRLAGVEQLIADRWQKAESSPLQRVDDQNRLPSLAARRARTASIAILQTGAVARVALPNRLPSVIEPYDIALSKGICREHGWVTCPPKSDMAT
jgi:hypothetical protein